MKTLEEIALGVADAVFTGNVEDNSELLEFSRRLIAKFAEGVEPVAYAVLEGREIENSGWGFIAPWPEACHEHINNAINEYDIEGAKDWKVIPLYPASTIAAAQQQTAEACAKAAVEWGNSRQDDNGGHALRNYAESLRSGEWRKYLEEPK